ncbi:MAG: histidine kinase [Dermatophilaceae bacterium]
MAQPQHRGLYWLSLAVIVFAVISFLDDARSALGRPWPGAAFDLINSASLSAIGIAVVLQRRWLPVCFVCVAGAVVFVHPKSSFMLALCLALAAATFRNDRRPSTVLVGVFFVVRLATVLTGRTTLGNMVFLEIPLIALIGVAGWALGNAVRRRKVAEERVRELARQAEQARERERSLLARELHDVVAHELTIIAMQASVMRMTSESSELAEARDAIERTSRTALDELKRLLQVLRTSEVIDEGDAAVARDVPAVVEDMAHRLRSLGHPVQVTCEVGSMPRSIELAADRVLREATTNIIKHATERAACAIEVRERDAVLHVRVCNALPHAEEAGTNRGLPSTRLGLWGLEERLLILGGTFEAFRDANRWVIRAALPLAPPESVATDERCATDARPSRARPVTQPRRARLDS